MTSTPDLKSNQTDNHTQPKDALVIIISDTSSGSSGDHRVEFEDAPEIILVNSSSDSSITRSPEIVTIDSQPIDSESEPKATSCHLSASADENVATSSQNIAPTNEKEVTEGIVHLFSQFEEVLTIRKGSANVQGLRSRRSYKVNYNKPSTSFPLSSSPSLVVPMGQNESVDSVTFVSLDINERPSEPFKYDLVKHLKHILHVCIFSICCRCPRKPAISSYEREKAEARI